MIKIVKFPFCNFYSLERYLRIKGLNYTLLNENEIIEKNDIIFMPGVGTFGEGVNYLESNNFSKKIVDHAKKNGRIIGICLGMQLLFDSSEESPKKKGLEILQGSCKKIIASKNFPVPHIGCNSLVIKKSNGYLNEFSDLNGESLSDYYFVHSFHVIPEDTNIISASFNHPIGLLTSAIY